MGSIFCGEELRLAIHSSAFPKKITCKELKFKGPEGNLYVTLTDFKMRWGGGVSYTFDERSTTSLFLIPLAVKGDSDDEPQPHEIVAVLHVRENPNQQDWRKKLEEGKVTGLIESRGLTNRVPIGSREQIRAQNPGIPLEECWDLHGGTAPSTVRMTASVYGAGILFLALGLRLMVQGFHFSTGEERQATRVLYIMMPILFLMAAFVDFAHFFRRTRFYSAQFASSLLFFAGLPLCMLGGYLVWEGCFQSLTGFSSKLVLGAISSGVGLFFLSFAVPLMVQAPQLLERGELPLEIAAAGAPSVSQRPTRKTVAATLMILGSIPLAGIVFCVWKGAAPSTFLISLLGLFATVFAFGAMLYFVDAQEKKQE